MAVSLHADEVPATPTAAAARDLYNSGTRQMEAGKLDEAEGLFEGSLAGQISSLQPLALYNLGCVRVAQGVDLLKKSNDPSGKSTQSHVDMLSSVADGASRAIDEAIASENEQKMIEAYMRGRGIHHEIGDAEKAVSAALESKQDILTKWQRADGDFRSAAEMQPKDGDAAFNARTTEKAIAALIDKQEKLQQGAMKMKMSGQALGEKLKKLKGMIPAPDMPPGGGGDDDEPPDMPGMKPGDKEKSGKMGKEMQISPEEAAQILAGFKLKGDHNLPLNQEGTAKPKDHNGKDW